MLARYLEKFERMVSPERYAAAEARFRAAFAWQPLDEPPWVWGELPPVPDGDWPDPPYNDAFYDREQMLLGQLRAPFLHHQAGDDHPLAIRAHYGTVILPSLFGAPYQLTETSLPWGHPLPGGREAIRRVVEAGVPSLDAGLGRACMETAAYYLEALAPYPNLRRCVRIYHPDLQGPFDVAHLLWGPDIFLALFDCPELVHALLRLVVETYRQWLTRWYAQLPEDAAWTAHWNIMMPGAAMLRDDTATLLSARQYATFVQPYDQALLDAFEGCIHFCGRGDHLVERMFTSRHLHGLHISQPELNDMPRVWALSRARRIVLLDVPEEYLPAGPLAGVTVKR